MSVPDEPVKNTASVSTLEDVDDDYLSIASEKFHEDESIDSVCAEILQSIINEFADEKKEEPPFDSIKTSNSDVLTLENTFDDEENKSNHSIERNEKLFVTSTSSDSDKQTEIVSIDSETTDQTEQPKQSTVNIQTENQSIVNSFYIPDASEIDKQQSNMLQQYVENKNDQIESSENKQDQSISQSNTNNQQELNILDKFSDKQQQQIQSEPTPISSAEMVLATIPISELPDHGYELHNIKLTQPTETIPVGFKLTKQTDPLQYILTVIVEQSKADIAGLKVDDWLIKIEDNDIRLSDLYDISQNINQILNSVGYINMLIARKKSVKFSSFIENQRTSVITAYDIPDETNILLSVGLSNRIEDENQNQSIHEEYAVIQSDDTNKPKIRHITLKESSELFFNSFISDNNNQNQVHFITNIQPISIAYRAGLRNNDRILTVNDIDVTNISYEDVRLMILKNKPIQLTVINDPKYLELIEDFKRNQNSITSSPSSNYESIEQRKSKDLTNVLFIDDKGPVYIKHCIVKKQPTYDALGFLLYYIDNIHIIDNVEINLPGYNSGLRNGDVILFINKKNIEQMTHDDVTILLRSLTISNRIINLILINKNDIQRYKNYQEKNFIDWNNILSTNNEDDTNKIQTEQKHFYVNQLSNTPRGTAIPSLLAGDRICVLETSTNLPAGFTISGLEPPPFTICKIEKDSPAEKAGLQLNDALLSINGKSVLKTNYEDTIKIVKEALQQKTVQFVVNQQLVSKEYLTKRGSQSITSDSSDDSDLESTTASTVIEEPCHRSTNAVQQYQKQRTKELSYTLRVCHLHATNTDGASASTFGFEITEDPEYEYPIISRVEPKLPGENAGLQLNDILLKVNNRKTKGLDFDKVIKAIEKAKRDGRLEMLVADKEVFYYCKQTNKKFKEPYIKVKHIFPKSKSTAIFSRLPSIATTTPLISQDSIERLKNGTSSSDIHRLSLSKETQSENEEDNLILPTLDLTLNFDISSSINPPDTACTFFPEKTRSTSIDPALNSSQQKNISSTDQNVSSTKQGLQSHTSSDESILDSIINTINHFFQNIGSEKSIKPHYDIPLEGTNNSKPSTPISSIGELDQNLFEQVRHISQLHSMIRSNQSSGLYDYIRDPRRCVLKIERNKGLGFVLSATGDYDHTVTLVEKNSVADVAGLQVNDEVVEVDGVDVRSIKYEQVIDMLISAIRTNDTIEMYVINSRLNDFYSSPIDTNKGTNIHNLYNGNNNNNNNSISATSTTAILSDDLSDKNSTNGVFDGLNQQTMDISYSDLHSQLKHLNNVTDRGRSGSVSTTFSTGITASPKDFRSTKTTSTSSKKDSVIKILNTSKKDAPVARLCRIRKSSSSPFYGFFLSGDRKKLGKVYVSNLTKNSSAAICGLRDGDRIIEVNGTNIETLTYETILNKIQLHMECNDLELLVLDKKSLRWYHKRKYPITSQTLPTIIHIEPVINDMNSEIQSSKGLDTYITDGSFANRQSSTTSL